jgi:F-type H+-transporting ATPase subunit alpha
MTSSFIKEVRSQTASVFGQVLKDHSSELRATEVGTVTGVSRGVVRVAGLRHIQSEELVLFPDSRMGVAFSLDEDEIGVVLLGDQGSLSVGDEARRSGRLLSVPVGDELTGRVVDPLGRPLDQRGPLTATSRDICEKDAPDILDRLPVTIPLQTGIKVIDALVPIGRGQRELIVGDRQTGKTAIALDTILNQRTSNVLCVYCAVGQRTTAVASAVKDLRVHGAMDYTVVVVAEGDGSPGLQYVAPFAATTIAERYMEQGRDVLIVYDDLTTHARAYRELSLLLRRPPGREAFPGDIFYLHSRLLERSTHLNEHLGGGSLTALAIAETSGQDLSGYIPTNLISITDGQIYLSPELFQKGQLPAVDVGKSVSRVGGKTQRPAYRSVAGNLRLSYAQFEELEAFSRFSSRLDPATLAALERGRRVRVILRQAQYQTLTVPEQLASLMAVTEGLLDDVPLLQIPAAQSAIQQGVTSHLPDICLQLSEGDKLSEQSREQLCAWMDRTLESFRVAKV